MRVTHLSKNERQRKDLHWVLLNDFSGKRRAEWSRANKRVQYAVKKSKTCCTRARSAIATCAHKPTHVLPNNLTATVMTSLSHLSLPSVFLSLSLSLYKSPAPFPFITVQISLLAIQSSRCHLWLLGSYFPPFSSPPLWKVWQCTQQHVRAQTRSWGTEPWFTTSVSSMSLSVHFSSSRGLFPPIAIKNWAVALSDSRCELDLRGIIR